MVLCMRFRWAFAVLSVAWTLGLATSGAGAAEPVQMAAGAFFPPAMRKAIDGALDKAFAESGAPGVAVGIWIPGEGNYVATRGVNDVATRRPMRADDHFRIGSITKTFTVTALLQLADEKKLGLDDPVEKYATFVPDGANITLRMLANMTSGLFNYTEDDAWVTTAFSDFQRTWTPRELVDVGLAHPPYFAPGKGFHYSNTNTVLLGMIIEQVTKKPIAQVFGEKIITPLRLAHTIWPTTSALPPPYAHGVTEQTLDNKKADATNRNPSWAFTAGQLVSTLGDLRVWVESYATGSLISPEMQKERLTYVTLPPNTATRKYGLGIGSDNGWLGHSGELPGYNTGAYYLPDRQAVVVVMVNSDIAVDKVNPMTIIFKALAAVIAPDHVPN
jgi:D-alanyl-D-alanine carboxypeptidase